jgi:hypothetical protein
MRDRKQFLLYMPNFYTTLIDLCKLIVIFIKKSYIFITIFFHYIISIHHTIILISNSYILRKTQNLANEVKTVSFPSWMCKITKLTVTYSTS